eukprot:TRINITY_DN3052_c0_g1_i1.p1 TRINITY_DN3052_c0_g1~~TRINITY_DN3052_c0_g1_i1.p1  ORF type:complete len:801 (+),score=127.99 TRINITY_DN3052_c0_g1_i1:42-2444(+)
MYNERLLMVIGVPVLVIVTHMVSEDYTTRRLQMRASSTPGAKACPACPAPTVCPSEAPRAPCPVCAKCPAPQPPPPPPPPPPARPTPENPTKRKLSSAPWTQWIDQRSKQYFMGRQIMAEDSPFIKGPLCVPDWTVSGTEVTASGGCVLSPLDTFKAVPKGTRVTMIGDVAFLHVITKTMDQSPEIKREDKGGAACWTLPENEVRMCVHKVEGRDVTSVVVDVCKVLHKGDLLVVMVGSLYDRASLGQFSNVVTNDPEVAHYEARARRLLRTYVSISDEAVVARLYADTTVSLIRSENARNRGVEMMWVTPLPRFVPRDVNDVIDGVYFETRLIAPVKECTNNYSNSFVREHAIAAAFEDAAEVVKDDPVVHVVDVSSGLRVIPKSFDSLESTELLRGKDGFPQCTALRKSVAQGLGNMVMNGVAKVMRPKQPVNPALTKWSNWMTSSSKRFWEDRTSRLVPNTPLCTPTWEIDTSGEVFKASGDEHLKYLGYNGTQEAEKKYIDHPRNYEYCPYKMRASGCQERLAKLIDCMENNAAVWFIGDSTITLPYLRLLAEGVSEGATPSRDYKKVKGGVKELFCNTVYNKDKSRSVLFCLYPGAGRDGPKSMKEVVNTHAGPNDVIVVMLGTHYNVWEHHRGRDDKSRWDYEREAAGTMPSWVPDKYHNIYSRLHGDINKVITTYKQGRKATQRLVWAVPLPQFFHLEGNLAPAGWQQRLNCLNTSERVGMAREFIVSQALRDHGDAVSYVVDLSSAERNIDGGVVPTVTSRRGDCSHACVDVNTVLGRMLVHGVCRARANRW